MQNRNVVYVNISTKRGRDDINANKDKGEITKWQNMPDQL